MAQRPMQSGPSARGGRKAIRTLIVDDSPLFLERAVRWLNKEPNLEVVGQATSQDEAITKVQGLRPDLVMIDLALAGHTNGIEVAKRMKQETSPPAVILMSVHDLDAMRKHWAGHVDAVLGKDRFSSDISVTLKAIFPGYDK